MTAYMRIHIISLFPDSIHAYLGESILKRARERKLLVVSVWNPRDYTADKHRKADDRPFGGGPGMVLKAEPILKSVEAALKGGRKQVRGSKKIKIIILSPRGKQFTNAMAAMLAKKNDTLVLIAGRYEGIDARVKKILRAEEISVGPYVLTGGELPALTVLDAIARHIPGVLGKHESLEENRLAAGEVYTRPEVLVYKKKSHKVPKVLLTGHHRKIEEWKGKK